MALPLMLNVKFLPFTFEYEVDRYLYENNFEGIDFFEYYTHLLELRDKHCAGILFYQNLQDEIQRLEQAAGYFEYEDDEDYDYEEEE